MTHIPITLSRRPGYENDPQSFVSPVVSLSIAAVPEVPVDGIHLSSHKQPIRALLDTGADLIYVDETLLERLGAKSQGKDQAMTKTLHGERSHNIYFVSLHFPGMKLAVGAYVTGVPLGDGSRAYEAILGMAFLKQGRLVLDAAGESYFEFGG
jgi:hypothetical protein